MKMKRMGVSLGDPAGIGPEVLVKSFHTIENLRGVVPIVIGDIPVIEKNLRFSCASFSINRVQIVQDIKKGYFNIYSPGIIKNRGFTTGKDTRLTGNASFQYVCEAVRLWKEGFIDALVTLPISKNAWHLAGHNYSGHTELLAEKLGVKNYAMIMLADRVRVLLLTTHIPLKDVPGKLRVQLIVDKVGIGYKFLKDFGIKDPVIGISALNPHAGEKGLLGTEEKKLLIPAIRILRRKGVRCEGPFPADSVFKKAFEGKFDIVVAMYHDQGMIPLKTFCFNKLVNCTAGLGMVRTSPGHGTGFDIAYTGKADPSAFIKAYKVAVHMLNPV